jgi:hypothetical protein
MQRIPPTVEVANDAEEYNQFPPLSWSKIDKQFRQIARFNTEHSAFFLEFYPRVSDNLDEFQMEEVQNKLSTYLRAIQN